MEFASSLLSSAGSALAAASKPSLSSSYTPDPSSSPLSIGVWRVTRAKHSSNGKAVSIWTADKSALSSGGGANGRRGGGARDRDRDAERLKYAVEVLKKEASSLSRLRHPCVLEMAEPMEETRSSILFATEPVTSSLRHAILASDAAASHDASRGNNSYRSKEEQDAALDEVEIQKGFTQLGKGLQFLHESAKLVHGNLTPESVIINAKGDWKLSGFGLAQYLFDPQGVPAKWSFPQYDPNLPPSLQLNYDYLAPEYILDESAPSPSNDMYSLGILLHTLHTPTGPPFSNRNSLQLARTNLEEGLAHNLVASQWRKLPSDVQEVLGALVTRYPNRRLTAAQFLSSRYFEGLLVGTLRFLERDSFASKSSEAQASFLKGLVTVLPQFSTKVNRRKVLPSLLEETRKANLVPFLLPNILYIASKMDNDAFRDEVLPGLTPLFTLREPPQAVVSLLENLGTFSEKCSAAVFREEVMPLIYHALESDNPLVLEKALRVVPGLCESALDYTTVKQTLFPKITHVFSKTTLLSVKVNTLICFHSMIKILDKFTLTEKLVPLLAKIKTKEPSVMIATLAVHEEMGKKCEVEAIATLILPQLWSMSIGPLLNVDQFTRFMAAIKTLSLRVETEHTKHLAELKRLEESSGAGAGGGGGGGLANTGTGEVRVGQGEVTDFETLVRGGVNGRRVEGLGGGGRQVDIFADSSPAITPMPTGNGFSSPPLPALPNQSPALPSTSSFSPPPSRPATFGRVSTAPTPASAATNGARNSPGARPLGPSSSSSAFPAPPSDSSSFPSHISCTPPAAAPTGTATLRSFAPLQPGPARTGSSTSISSNTTTSSAYAASQQQQQANRPNYNLSLSTTPANGGGFPSLTPTTSSLYSSSASSSSTPAAPPPPQSIQWNKVPPISSSSSSSSAAPPPSFAQPIQPTSSFSSPPPKPSSSPLPPPGYNPSSSFGAPLQPNRPAGTPGGGAGAGGQGTRGMNFGNWADLDPLK
ncbi:hypothetical protein JCM8547_000155 [Rhodosporidiobolus lusitaniae]